MSVEDDHKRLRFDLADRNLQSVSRAQHFYLSALLVYLCLVWGWFFVGSGQAVTVDLFGLGLKTAGVWKITPLVTMLLTLALAGSVNAFAPALEELNAAREELGVGGEAGIFYVDSHKNVFDYFARLQLWPEGATRKPAEDSTGSKSLRLRLHHLWYPALFVASAYTSYHAVFAPLALGGVVNRTAYLFYGLVCFGIQVTCSVRPVYRWLCRFLGVRTDRVYG
ncbi:MAG: hypothetical protein KGL59_05625 [Acidobacteriota bacterium]|nr:hypothetical protein [Acidobacteriota bacterium]